MTVSGPGMEQYGSSRMLDQPPPAAARPANLMQVAVSQQKAATSGGPVGLMEDLEAGETIWRRIAASVPGSSQRIEAIIAEMRSMIPQLLAQGSAGAGAPMGGGIPMPPPPGAGAGMM